MHDTTYIERLLDLFGTTLRQVEEGVAKGLDLETVIAEVQLDEQKSMFAGGDPAARAAFERDYRVPAIRSVWATLHPESATSQ
jgi:hypothetical protein